MIIKRFSLLTAVAALAGAYTAQASVTLTFDGVNPESDVTLASSGAVSFGATGVQAGVYQQTINGVATPSFCIDIARDITLGQTFTDYSYVTLSSAPLTPAGPMGATAAADIEKLWAAYYSPSMSSVNAAALQVAIWEDIAAKVGTYTLTVSGNSPVTSEASTMLASIPTLTAEADLVGLVSTDGQNYVVAVPEPTTMMAGALLLLPFGASALRIIRRNRLA